MKHKQVSAIAAILCCSVLSLLSSALAQGEGEQLFKQVCAACHTINSGKLVGPDLANVHKRRSQEWLLSFIKSSQSVIKSGDEYAVKLFEEFNKIPMPDNNYSDAQILSIIDYIVLHSPDDAAAGKVTQADWPPHKVTEENIRSGERLFVGKTGLANGGPTCISCHNVKYDGIRAGGALAKDLTDAYSRLGGSGVTAMIRNSPFPAMNRAFTAKPLTEEELFDLTAFLQHVAGHASADTPNYMGQLFFSGLGGALVLLGLLSVVWVRAKKGSVNHAIYARQIKSTTDLKTKPGQGGKP